MEQGVFLEWTERYRYNLNKLNLYLETLGFLQCFAILGPEKSHTALGAGAGGNVIGAFFSVQLQSISFALHNICT